MSQAPHDEKRPMREYTYVVDEEGLIWQGGEQYDAPEIHEQFYRNMTRDEQGRIYTTCFGERCWIVPKDTPFVIQMVRVATSGPDHTAVGVTLVLNGGIEEPLDPASLAVGEGNVLYTSVREGAFPARFTRKAYYELARHIEQDEDGFALILGGRRHPIGNSDSGE